MLLFHNKPLLTHKTSTSNAGTLEDVAKEVPQASLPVYVGGGGGGKEGNEDVVRYVRSRLLNFPPIPASL